MQLNDSKILRKETLKAPQKKLPERRYVAKSQYYLIQDVSVQRMFGLH